MAHSEDEASKTLDALERELIVAEREASEVALLQRLLLRPHIDPEGLAHIQNALRVLAERARQRGRPLRMH